VKCAVSYINTPETPSPSRAPDTRPPVQLGVEHRVHRVQILEGLL